MAKNPIDPTEFFNRYTTKGKDPMIIQLKNVRLAFPDIWKPTAFEEGQELKYGATFLIAKTDPQHKMVEAAIKEVAAAEWKTKATALLESIKGTPQKYCYNDGDTGTRASYDGYKGHMALSSKNKKRPTIVDSDKTPLTEADEKPYGGCYVNASVELWAQTGKHAGMRCSLRGIQFVKDGDAFTAGSVASDDEFEDLGDGANAGDDDLA